MIGALTGRVAWYAAAGLAVVALGLAGAVKVTSLRLDVARASGAILERTIAQQAAEVKRIRRERDISAELIQERDERAARRDAQLSSLKAKVRVMERENEAIRAMGECVVPDSYVTDWLRIDTDGRDPKRTDVPAGDAAQSDTDPRAE